MTQNNSINNPSPEPHISDPSAKPGPTATPHKRKWLRRALYIVGGLLVMLILLVLLIPTIANMGFVRSIVVGKINNNLNGRVQIASWSLGWSSGIKAEGIKVFDDQNRQILEIPHVSTQLSLINAIKGKYELGDTVVQGLDFNAIRYADGTLNFQHLAKSHTSQSQNTKSRSVAESNGTTASKSSESKLPQVSGRLRLVQARGTVENITQNSQTGAVQHDMVKFPSIAAEVKIPGINQPITDSLEIVEDNGMPQPGKLNLSGQITLAKNNLLLPAEQMDGNQNIALSHIELKGFAWAAPGMTLAGNTSGNLAATLTPGTGATVSGSIESKNFKYGGPALEGDTYSADGLVISVPKTVANFRTVNGATTVDHLRIGEGSGQTITITLANTVRGKASQSTIKLTADSSVDALNNLAANKAPGANGNLRADVDLDVVPLAETVPHVLKMIEGSRLDSGRLVDTIEIQMAPNQATITENLAVSPITGERPNHERISIDPITLSVKTTDRGGAGKVPDLRDNSLILATASNPAAGWASANITAPTLTALKGSVHADLQRAQAQLGQLMDTGTLKLGGTLDVALQSEGDLVSENKPGQTTKNSITVNTRIRDLVIDGMKDKPPIKEPQVTADLSANLERGSDGMVQFVRDLKAKVLAGNEAKPSIILTAAGNLDLSQKAGSQEAIQSNLSADLPQVQNEFGGFMTFLSDDHLQVTSGALTGTTNVTSGANHQLNLTSDLAINSLSIIKPQAKGLENEQVKLTVDMRAADDFSTADVNRIDLTTSFLTANFSDTHLILSAGTGKDAKAVQTLDMVRKFVAKIDIPAMGKLQQVLDDFSPPAAAPAVAVVSPPPARGARSVAAQPAPTSEPPPAATKLAGGSATITLAANRLADRLSIVPTMAARNVILRKPDRDAPVGDMDVTATEISLFTNSAPSNSKATTRATTEPSIMDQIHELKIGQLVARLNGAELTVNGSVVDLGNTRTFQNFGADLNYDAPKLWQLLVPFMFDKASQAKWKDAKVAGNYKKHFTVAGSYPAEPIAGRQPISNVTANGELAFDHFEAQGMAIDKLILPLSLGNGIFSTTYPGKSAGQDIAAPASVNGGTIDLGGIAVDLNGPHMLLNIPSGKKLFDNVSLNPTLAQLVGDWVNNPMFVTANEAAGQMFFIINKCVNLPMDDLVTQPIAANQGVFDANIKVNKIHLGNEIFQKVSDGMAAAKVFGGQSVNVKSLQGDISDWHVTIQHGITHQDMTMTFGESSRPLKLSGDVAMQTRQMNMVMDMPWDFFGLKNKVGSQASGGGVSIPITGPVTNPQVDIGKVVQKNLAENGAQDILQGILGQGKEKNAKPGTQPTSKPSKPEKENPLGALQDLLNKNKK